MHRKNVKKSNANNILFSDDGDGLEEDFTDITASDKTSINNETAAKKTSDKTFQSAKRLEPKEVYIATIGAFEKSNFKLQHIVRNPSTYSTLNGELARVYRKHDDGMLYVIYYPGKDNDKIGTQDNSNTALNEVIKNANEEIINFFGKKQLEKAKKLFVVAESNSYYGIPVMHYIKADITNGILTTDDSIDRDYNESYLNKNPLLPHSKRVVIKRGLQPMISDTWSCGHHAIHRIFNDINGLTDPTEFSVDQKTLDDHADFYRAGFSSWANKPVNTLDPNNPALEKREISFATSSKFCLNSTHVTLESITKMFRALALDNNLEIILAKSKDNHDRTLRIYTHRSIHKLNQLGLKPQIDTNGNQYYELTITPNDLTAKSHLPLFYLPVKVDGKTILPLDISHILSTENIREARKQPHRNLKKPETTNNNQEKIIDIIQKTNIYMKTLLGHDIDKISSADKNYLYRLHSWNKVLKTFDDFISKKTDIATLLELIQKEASTFKTIHHSKRYTNQLYLLANAITKHLYLADPCEKLATKISNYSDLYQQIKNLHTQSVSLKHEPRLFPSHLAAKEREMELYYLLKSNLTPEDRYSFPSLRREEADDKSHHFTSLYKK